MNLIAVENEIESRMVVSKKQKKQQSRRRHRRLALAVVLPVGIALFFGGAFFAYGSTYSGKLLPGVIVAGADVGGKPVVVAQRILASMAQDYDDAGIRVTLASRVITPKASDLGLRFDIDQTLERALSIGRETTFRKTFQVPSFGRRGDLRMVVRLDQAKLAEYLTVVENGYSVPMINPHVAWKDGAYVVTEASEGERVVHPDFAEVLLMSAESLRPFLVELSYEKIFPVVTAEDLTEAKSEMVAMTSRPLTLTFGSKKFTAEPELIQPWLRQDYESSKVVDDPRQGIVIGLDKPMVSQYLQELNAKIGTPPKQTYGYLAEQQGEYAYKNAKGQEIKIPETSDAILAALRDGASRRVEIVMGEVEPVITLEQPKAPKDSGKVIAVDISRQTTYAYEDGKLVFWTRASTGKGDTTKEGEWKVYNKNPDQVMDGPGYYLPHVKWVLAYDGDYTLHGTYWHTKFGQPMSHGCTNLSEADAKWLYDWAPLGTPVVIYRSEKG